jgi:hypothetical protein
LIELNWEEKMKTKKHIFQKNQGCYNDLTKKFENLKIRGFITDEERENLRKNAINKHLYCLEGSSKGGKMYIDNTDEEVKETRRRILIFVSGVFCLLLIALGIMAIYVGVKIQNIADLLKEYLQTNTEVSSSQYETYFGYIFVEPALLIISGIVCIIFSILTGYWTEKLLKNKEVENCKSALERLGNKVERVEQVQKEANMKVCSKCGQKAEKNTQFCPNCGNKLVDKE